MFSRQEICTVFNICLQNKRNNNCLIKMFVLNAASQGPVEQINWRLSKMQFSYRKDKVEGEKWESRAHFSLVLLYITVMV